MIDLNEIALCIDKPELVCKKEINAFDELSKKYPYTQLYSLLYLKGLKDTNDVHFDDALLKHSFRITDRVRLYDLIKEKDEPSVKIEMQPEDTLKIEPTKEQEKTEELEEKLEGEFNSEAEVREEQKEPTETIEQEDSTSNIIDNLELDIVHNAITANYELPELTEEEILELELKDDIIPESEISEKETLEVNTKLSFSSWIKSNSNYKEELNLDKQAINELVNSFNEFDPSEQLFGEIERPKKEFFSPTKKAKESLKEDDLPVSETLAKIYAAQGNYPKAINAYEQLILKNPEKKSFFAILIKELKKKINDR